MSDAFDLSLVVPVAADAPDVPADAPAEGGESGAAVAEPPVEKKSQAKGKRKTKPKRPGMLPPWRVLLHNDDVNTIEDVVDTVATLTPLDQFAAVRAALEAHRRGLSLLLVTHKERAELYVEQFKSRCLKVTIEPAD